MSIETESPIINDTQIDDFYVIPSEAYLHEKDMNEKMKDMSLEERIKFMIREAKKESKTFIKKHKISFSKKDIKKIKKLDREYIKSLKGFIKIWHKKTLTKR